MVGWTKLKIPAAVFWVAVLAIVILYKYPPSFDIAAQDELVACDGAKLSIDSVACSNGVLRVALSNAGAGNLSRQFMIYLSSDAGQVYAGGETDAQLAAGKSATLSVVLDNWRGIVQSARVASQSCPSVEAVADGLEVYCGPEGSA
jgi:hypothetical protein